MEEAWSSANSGREGEEAAAQKGGEVTCGADGGGEGGGGGGGGITALEEEEESPPSAAEEYEGYEDEESDSAPSGPGIKRRQLVAMFAHSRADLRPSLLLSLFYAVKRPRVQHIKKWRLHTHDRGPRVK
jgi:hypothetical protein